MKCRTRKAGGAPLVRWQDEKERGGGTRDGSGAFLSGKGEGVHSVSTSPLPKYGRGAFIVAFLSRPTLDSKGVLSYPSGTRSEWVRPRSEGRKQAQTEKWKRTGWGGAAAVWETQQVPDGRFL